MGLSIFVHRKLPKVGIVRWFRDPKVRLDYASGPVIQMALEQFRATGFEWVCKHFEEYQSTRLPEEDVVKVFAPGEAKKLMQDRSALEINQDDEGNLLFSPRAIQRYDLAYLESLGKESRRVVPKGSSADDFWRIFDEVLSLAVGA
jgi:hypothetical protein